MKISLVVPTWNHVDRLEVLFHSLEQQVGVTDWELVVVNDGSGDGTKAFLDAYRGPLPLKVLHQENQGTAGARHAGASAATGDVVLFLDDDMILPANFLAAHLKAHEQEHIVVAGRVVNILPGAVQTALPLLQRGDYEAAMQYRGTDSLVDLGEAFAKALGNDYVPWAACIGGNFSLRRADYERAGGYDLRFRSWGPEDLDLTYRLSLLGLRFRYVREASSYHLDHVSEQKGQMDKVFSTIKYFYMKHNTPEVAAYAKYATGKLSWAKFCRALTGVVPEGHQHEFHGEQMMQQKTREGGAL